MISHPFGDKVPSGRSHFPAGPGCTRNQRRIVIPGIIGEKDSGIEAAQVILGIRIVGIQLP
jgi:hypothetical protein